MSTRQERVKKFGREVVEDDEATWRKRGYSVNHNTGLLDQIKKPAKSKSKLKKMAKKAPKERFTQEGRRRIQHYGEQHSDFHTAQRESKRMKDPWWSKK